MKILGIDPGLKATGYGLIEVKKIDQVSENSFSKKQSYHFQNKIIKLLEAGTIQPKQKDLFQNRIEKVYANLEKILLQFEPEI